MTPPFVSSNSRVNPSSRWSPKSLFGSLHLLIELSLFVALTACLVMYDFAKSIIFGRYSSSDVPKPSSLREKSGANVKAKRTTVVVDCRPADPSKLVTQEKIDKFFAPKTAVATSSVSAVDKAVEYNKHDDATTDELATDARCKQEKMQNSSSPTTRTSVSVTSLGSTDVEGESDDFSSISSTASDHSREQPKEIRRDAVAIDGKKGKQRGAKSVAKNAGTSTGVVEIPDGSGRRKKNKKRSRRGPNNKANGRGSAAPSPAP